MLSASRSASALQPIDAFVSAAREHSPSNEEARAMREEAVAAADETLGRALPGLSVTGTYTRNEYEVDIGPLTLYPQNQLDAFATISVPLVDLAKFARISGANRGADGAREEERATQLRVQARVVQDYYQLAANIALAEVARSALETARAKVERESQQLTSAELQVKLAARALESETGLAANSATGLELADDLHSEAPLESYLSAARLTPEVRAASFARRAAEHNPRAQRLSLVPALDAFATEHVTNATAFLAGHNAAYLAGATLSWRVDFATAPAVRKRDADASAAKAREEQARIAAGDAVFQAWTAVEANIARSRSARVQAVVSRHAADLAQTRYRNGAATQLELIEADRDAFSADAARIQADADVANARTQLRIASGVDPFAQDTTRAPR